MMQILDQEVESGSSLSSSLSYAGLIERAEILRSALRWATHLDRPEIEKLLRQSTALRDEVMHLSHKERFVMAAAAPQRPASSHCERRRALIERSFVFEGAFGENPSLLEALEIAEKAAPTDLPVLIDGESGTGKELMAKVIHANGHRGERPFISVNCGAIPENLLESELFGHRRGSFTGASSDRKGKFESAHNGTIFLDEIGELPMSGQVKLLRVLEAREIQRVGSDEPIAVNTRVVAATNRNLRRMCDEGRFREDLFYRLSIIHVSLPPLRERRDELPLLFEFFCGEAAESLKRSPIGMTRRLREFLLGYDYPGNIRELRNIILRLSCLAGPTADVEHLPADLRPVSVVSCVAPASAVAPAVPASAVPAAPAAPVRNGAAHATLTAVALSEAKRHASDQAERDFLERGLQAVGGVVTELARRCEMNRSHVQTLLKKHGLRSKDGPGRASLAS